MADHPATQAATVESAPHARRPEALQLLHINRSRIQDLLTAENSGTLDMRGLFLARRADRPVGAAWGQIVPGRSAFCWPACLVPDEPEVTALQLQAAVDAFLDSQGVSVVQAVLPVRAATENARLTRAGYHYLADLDYLVSLRNCFPRKRPQSDLELQCYTAADQPRLAALIERTYVGSLDCAELDGTRNIEDVLTGYRQTGKYRPDWWLFARHAGRDVGCVLLADHPEHDQSELMYLGIVPESRGRRWGAHVTRYAQWLVGHAPRERLVLAVDSTNWPAHGVYSVTGFDHWDRRRVYIRTVTTSESRQPMTG